MAEQIIHCKYDALVPIKDLKAFAKNRNTHNKEQIKQLAKILVHQGLRAPIVVDDDDKCTIMKGHGTCEAIRFNKWSEAPVVFQKFINEEQKYLFCVSDNAIANQATLDISSIHQDIQELGPFEPELLGIKDFGFEPDPEQEDENKNQRECPNCGFELKSKNKKNK